MKLRRVNSTYVANGSEIQFNFSSVVHAISIFQTLFFQPIANFKVRNENCIASFSNLNSITHMVAMSVGDQDKIGRDFICSDMHGDWISGNERIKEQMIFTNGYIKA